MYRLWKNEFHNSIHGAFVLKRKKKAIDSIEIEKLKVPIERVREVEYIGSLPLFIETSRAHKKHLWTWNRRQTKPDIRRHLHTHTILHICLPWKKRMTFRRKEVTEQKKKKQKSKRNDNKVKPNNHIDNSNAVRPTSNQLLLNAIVKFLHHFQCKHLKWIAQD